MEGRVPQDNATRWTIPNTKHETGNSWSSWTVRRFPESRTNHESILSVCYVVQMSLAEVSEARKARLLALRKRKEDQEVDNNGYVFPNHCVSIGLNLQSERAAFWLKTAISILNLEHWKSTNQMMLSWRIRSKIKHEEWQPKSSLMTKNEERKNWYVSCARNLAFCLLLPERMFLISHLNVQTGI